MGSRLSCRLRGGTGCSATAPRAEATEAVSMTLPIHGFVLYICDPCVLWGLTSLAGVRGPLSHRRGRIAPSRLPCIRLEDLGCLVELGVRCRKWRHETQHILELTADRKHLQPVCEAMAIDAGRNLRAPWCADRTSSIPCIRPEATDVADDLVALLQRLRLACQ